MLRLDVTLENFKKCLQEATPIHNRVVFAVEKIACFIFADRVQGFEVRYRLRGGEGETFEAAREEIGKLSHVRLISALQLYS